MAERKVCVNTSFSLSSILFYSSLLTQRRQFRCSWSSPRYFLWLFLCQTLFGPSCLFRFLTISTTATFLTNKENLTTGRRPSYRLWLPPWRTPFRAETPWHHSSGARRRRCADAPSPQRRGRTSVHCGLSRRRGAWVTSDHLIPPWCHENVWRKTGCSLFTHFSPWDLACSIWAQVTVTASVAYLSARHIVLNSVLVIIIQ